MMLPVSWSEFLVIIGVSVCLLSKKEIPEVVQFWSNLIKQIKAFKMQAMDFYDQTLQEFEIEQLKKELTTTITGDDGKEYECYLPEALANNQSFVDELIAEEKLNLEAIKPEIIAPPVKDSHKA